MLEALTRVPEWSEKYVGKVKCVYIDPPFNTAKTFANYEDNLEHSVWLTMMRDRLLHLRDLLSEDGSIWVHLDDVQNHRMRVLLDEVFGAENFVSDIVWQRKYTRANDAKRFSPNTDNIVCYAKQLGSLVFNRQPRGFAADSRYSNPDGDERGPWKSTPLHAKSGRNTSGITFSNGVQWSPPAGTYRRFGEGTLLEAERDGRIYFPQNGEVPVFKKYLADMGGLVPVTLWMHTEVGSNDSAKREIQSLFPKTSVFSTPKPERLLERIIRIATNPGDIVLDVFAGSGTTAAVAQKMGRRWVTCELVEDTFNRFTRPRLEKVVNNEDQGGITLQKEERADATEDGLPEGLTPGKAQEFTSMLNKVIKNDDELKKNPAVKQVKKMTKTKPVKGVVNWRGGGGFTIAHLEPPCYDYDPEVALTTLTEQATGELLVRSVAAQLRFRLTSGDLHFDGKRGREHLVVVEGVLDEEKVDEVMAHLPAGHSVLFAATVVDESARENVRSFKNGSRVVHVPLDLFPYSNVAEEEK